MTANQINYSNYMESVRHNQVGEVENNRHNIAQEYETNRTNVANEKLREKEHKETKRSNKAREKETQRHDLATEGLTAQANSEQARSNQENEKIKREQTEATAAAQRYTAYMRYLATISAAQISAESAKYVSGVNKLIAELNNISKEKVASMQAAASKYNQSEKNKADKEIAELQTTTQKIIAANELAQTAIRDGNNYELGKARNEINNQLNEIQRMYNEGKLNIDELNAVNNILKNMTTNITFSGQ